VAILGPAATEEALEIVRHQLALDQPFYIQYYRWLSRMVTGDFGLSIALNIPVASVIFDKFGNTLILAAGSIILAVSFGIPIGVISATRQYSVFDRTSMIIALILCSMPVFWLGLVLIYLFAVAFPLFPALGMHDIRHGGGFLDSVRHLVLPSVTTSAIPMAIIARLVRTSLLDVLRQDHIVALRAKGLSKLAVHRHAIRNALPNIVTIIGLQCGFLITATIFTEVVFSWPGIGLMLYSSIVARDLPMIQAAVILLTFSFVVLNMVADIICHMIDPRQRAGPT
jgi:ABC-type dipeptide/oligopeptide/nickel transport system permease component